MKKVEAVTRAGRPTIEPLFYIFYTFVCKKVPGKITDKYMENLKHRYAPQIFYENPLLCSFSLQLISFSEQRFYGNYLITLNFGDTLI